VYPSLLRIPNHIVDQHRFPLCLGAGFNAVSPRRINGIIFQQDMLEQPFIKEQNAMIGTVDDLIVLHDHVGMIIVAFFRVEPNGPVRFSDIVLIASATFQTVSGNDDFSCKGLRVKSGADIDAAAEGDGILDEVAFDLNVLPPVNGDIIRQPLQGYRIVSEDNIRICQSCGPGCDAVIPRISDIALFDDRAGSPSAEIDPVRKGVSDPAAFDMHFFRPACPHADFPMLHPNIFDMDIFGAPCHIGLQLDRSWLAVISVIYVPDQREII